MRRKLTRAIRRGLQHWRNRRESRTALAAWARTAPAQPAGPQTVTLARVIGNDLHPRHADGQALRNLAFILEREPDFPDCRKLFVLNRLFDEAQQAEAERMVAQRGHTALVLPFSGAAYASLACDTSPFGGDDHFQSAAFAALPENDRDRERIWACAPKIHYAMNVNGARNAALDWGRQHGGWTILIDGSCFVSAAAWAQLRADMASEPFLPYLIIPMQRLSSNEHVDTVPAVPGGPEEPQLAIHASGRERFDERFPYGLRDKVALLDRIGVPGDWNDWRKLPWLPSDKAASPDRHLYKYARASVFRLSSGVAHGALERSDARARRYQSRLKAIFGTLDMLDDRFGSPDRDRARRIMGLAAKAGGTAESATR